MELKYLVCEICGEVIGQFDPEKLSLPLKGSMFLPKDIEHGFPPPFPDALEWVDLRCRMCGKRPFLEQDRVMTPEGYWMCNAPMPVGNRKCGSCDFWHIGQDPSGTGWCALSGQQMDETRLCNLPDEEYDILKEGLPPASPNIPNLYDTADPSNFFPTSTVSPSPTPPLAGTPNESYNPVSGADAGYLCQACGRSFEKRMALVGHMKGHSKQYGEGQEGKP